MLLIDNNGDAYMIAADPTAPEVVVDLIWGEVIPWHGSRSGHRVDLELPNGNIQTVIITSSQKICDRKSYNLSDSMLLCELEIEQMWRNKRRASIVGKTWEE